MASTPHSPQVSFILSTFNRRDILLQTIGQIHRCGLSPADFEILIIDNASSDGTVAAVARDYPATRVFPQKQNRGSCAKNIGIERARAPYTVFLDDDSYPHPGSVHRMIERFIEDPTLGAAGFNVHLTTGARECSAYPDVFIGCGVGFRKIALDQVGGLPTDFFMQAEEYDLSLRLLNAGWKIETFDDLHVTHLKTPAARWPTRVARLDARNNLTLIARHFPDQWKLPFAYDWMKRYWMIAAANNRRIPFLAGLLQGFIRLVQSSHAPISDAAFEHFARINQTRQLLQQAKRELNLKRILFVDLGKNILPYYLASRELNLEIVAIADARLGGRGNRYHGIPIVTDAQAASLSFDAAIVSNLSPVHAQTRAAQWRPLTPRPLIELFTPTARTAAHSRHSGSGRGNFNQTEISRLSQAA